MGEVDAAGFQLPCNLVAEGVVAQLAQKSTFAAQPGKGGAHVGRCAASARAERGNLVKRTATLDGIISMSASPMENSVLPDIENLPN